VRKGRECEKGEGEREREREREKFNRSILYIEAKAREYYLKGDGLVQLTSSLRMTVL